jgi:hypothetical protein
MSGRAWSFLAISGKRQYAGNEGYDDSVSSVYRFDSTVGNSRHVRKGDLAILRDMNGLLGVGIIDALESNPSASKQRNRCPVCNITAIKKRSGMSPVYRCHGGHEFNEPALETISVTAYEARYGEGWVSLNGAMDAVTLASVTMTQGTQNSIREVSGPAFARMLAKSHPQTRAVLSAFLQKLSPETLETNETGDSLPDDYVPSFEDRRLSILRSIKARRGQAKFRKSLVARHGPRCMISGCTIMEIVEAAHIWPYRGEEDNGAGNGLLLRADIHTLFDLDLVGIDPVTLTVHISPVLAGSMYESLAGQKITSPQPPNGEALKLRWEGFQKGG